MLVEREGTNKRTNERTSERTNDSSNDVFVFESLLSHHRRTAEHQQTMAESDRRPSTVVVVDDFVNRRPAALSVCLRWSHIAFVRRRVCVRASTCARACGNVLLTCGVRVCCHADCVVVAWHDVVAEKKKYYRLRHAQIQYAPANGRQRWPRQ